MHKPKLHLFVVAVRKVIGMVASYIITVTHYYDILLALILGCALILCNNYVTCHTIKDENSVELKFGEFNKLCYFRQTLFANYNNQSNIHILAILNECTKFSSTKLIYCQIYQTQLFVLYSTHNYIM